MPVFVILGSRQSVIQQMSRRADLSGHRNAMHVSVRLQTRDWPDNVCFWMSSTHRVLTATQCNESKRKRISVQSLDQRHLKLLKSSSEQPTEPSKHLRCHVGSLLTSTGSHSRAGQACLAARQTSSMGLHLSTLASAAVTAKTQTTYLEALRQLLGWLARATLLHNWTALAWDQTLAEYLEWSYDLGITQDMASMALAAVRWSLPNLPRPMSRSFPSAIACLQGWKRLEPGSSRPALGCWCCWWRARLQNTIKKSCVSTFACSSRRT